MSAPASKRVRVEKERERDVYGVPLIQSDNVQRTLIEIRERTTKLIEAVLFYDDLVLYITQFISIEQYFMFITAVNKYFNALPNRDTSRQAFESIISNDFGKKWILQQKSRLQPKNISSV